MKKLMLAAAAVAVAGGAFAHPEVYEYKAAVKNMYLKPVPVTVTSTSPRQGSSSFKADVYMKYQKNTNLKGWLIMDEDGVTSPTIMTDRFEDDGYASPSTGYDYGRNRGFLVVINPGAYKGVQHPKILPAVLDAKWIDTAFQKLGTATTGLAEGNLYLGGDAVKPVRPQLDYLESWDNIIQRTKTNDVAAVTDIADHVPYVPLSVAGGEGGAATNFTGMVAIADYLWTSVYLFADSGSKTAYYNGPNWFKNYPFGEFEYAWDANMPELLQTGWTNSVSGAQKKSKLPEAYYHDTWMNGTGVGKWSKGTITSELCCGADETVGNNDVVLESLSGNLKGGLFICTENGIYVDSRQAGYAQNYYMWFAGIEWEDQFNTARLNSANGFGLGTGFFAQPDSWQNDMWQDGFFEIETTDVIYGTWSIKRATAKFFNLTKPIATDTEGKRFKDLMAAVKKATADALPTEYETEEEVVDEETGETSTKKYTFSDGVFAYNETLWAAIDGAAVNLLANANTFNGDEIYALSVNTHHGGQFKLPMVTPQFALFYRLVYATDFTKTEQ